MARTKQTARASTGAHKRSNLWLEQWSRVTKNSEINLEDYIKQLLKYYPKGRRTLNLLTQTTQRIQPSYVPLFDPDNPPEELYEQAFDLKEARNRVIKRYKQEYFRHLNIGIASRSFCLNKSMKNVQTAVLARHSIKMKVFNPLLKKFLANNHNLKVLEISNQHVLIDSTKFLIRCLTYSRSVRTLAIKNVPYLPLRLWKLLINDLHPYLEDFTLQGALANEYSLDNMKTLIELLEIVFAMKSLKKFQFDVKVPANCEFDITRIPFHKLNQKQVSYDIRVAQSASELDITNITAPVLQNLDFLGLNNKILSISYPYLWQDLATHHLECQKKAKNRLFLHLPPLNKCNMPALIRACSNISVLDLSLGDLSLPIPDADCLKKLHSLRHLFIAINRPIQQYGDLFSNFAEGLQGNTTLASIALELPNTHAFENTVICKAFFSACADTVTKLSVKFEGMDEEEQSIKGFYESVGQLKNLRNIHIEMNPLALPNKELTTARIHHFTSLAKSLESSHYLEELTIKFPTFHPLNTSLDLQAFRNMKNLKKLVIDFGFNLIGIEQFQALQPLSSLSYLEFCFLRFRSDEEQWNLQETLAKNQSLQFIKIKCLEADFDDGDNLDRIESFARKLLRTHSNLKAVILASENSDLTVFQGRCCWREIEDILVENRLYDSEITVEKVLY